MKKYFIGGIQKFSTSDGPGILTTVFIKGCPLKCKWCHNPEMIRYEQQLMHSNTNCIHCGACTQVCPHQCILVDFQNNIQVLRDKCNACLKCAKTCYAGALKPAAYPMFISEIMQKVVQDKMYYKKTGGGVTLSGGEIITHPDFAFGMIEACQKENISVVLDTSGYGSFHTLLNLAKGCTDILYDIKCFDNSRHKEYTGVSNQLILDNLSQLSFHDEIRRKIWIRMPLISGVNDTDDIIQHTAAFLQAHRIEKATLLPYHELGTSKSRSLDLEPTLFTPPSEERLFKIKLLFESKNIRTDISGMGLT